MDEFCNMSTYNFRREEITDSVLEITLAESPGGAKLQLFWDFVHTLFIEICAFLAFHFLPLLSQFCLQIIVNPSKYI
jgi:hypothetical protein